MVATGNLFPDPLWISKHADNEIHRLESNKTSRYDEIYLLVASGKVLGPIMGFYRPKNTSRT